MKLNESFKISYPSLIKRVNNVIGEGLAVCHLSDYFLLVPSVYDLTSMYGASHI